MMPDPSRVVRGLYWDRSWRLVNGCTKVSPACAHCWSESETNVRGSNPAVAYRYAKGEVLTDGRWNGRVSLATERILTEPLRTKKPQVWAIWNDLFHEAVPFSYWDEVFTVIKRSEIRGLGHLFLLLTKRPDDMKVYMSEISTPANLWVGTTVEGPDTAWRLDPLRRTKAALRFVSFEPLLADVGKIQWTGISWAIVGCESGPRRRPTDVDWVCSLRDQAQAAGVSFFLKQIEMGLYRPHVVKMPFLDGKKWKQFPEVKE